MDPDCKTQTENASVCLCQSDTHISSSLFMLALRANNLFSLFNNHLAILLVSSPFAVIQDVDNASLEGQYQSFASLMEQRLAELFVLAGQQGTRFRRATTVGSHTVQVRNWHGGPQGTPGLSFSGRTNSRGCTELERENNSSF